jgi:hypothetical protein
MPAGISASCRLASNPSCYWETQIAASIEDRSFIRARSRNIGTPPTVDMGGATKSAGPMA